MNKLYWYHLLLVGLVVLCILAPGVALAQGDDDEETPVTPPIQVSGPFAVQRLIDDVRSATLIPDELYDPAFDRYIDLELLGQAWNEKDPALLTDVALQLAEGERILLRPHKAISADKLLEIAVRAATEKNDKTTLDRLAKAIKKGGNEKLKAQLATGSKLGGESRAVDPMTMVSIHEMTPETYAIYQNLVNQVQAARIGNSPALLDDLRQAVENALELSGQQREYLLKMISNARAEIPKDAKPDPGIEALDKLGDSSRGWFKSATGISTPTPIRKIAPNGISVRLREEPTSKLYPVPNKRNSGRIVIDNRTKPILNPALRKRLSVHPYTTIIRPDGSMKQVPNPYYRP